jgi:pilus assembly protein Flp/PilA
MLRRIRMFFADDCGATAIEYGLIVGLIFLAILTAFASVRTNLDNTYTTIGNAVSGN